MMFSNAAMLSLSKKLTFFVTSIVVFVFLYGVLPAASAPTVRGIFIESYGPYEAGDEIEVWVTFNDNVTVTGTPRLGLNIGGTTKYAYYEATDLTTLRLYYTVQASDEDRDGISISSNSLELNGGTIRAAGVDGEDANLNHDAVVIPDELRQAVNFDPFTERITITNRADFGEGIRFNDEMVGIHYTYVGARPTVSFSFEPEEAKSGYVTGHLAGLVPSVITIWQKPAAPRATVTVTLTGTTSYAREISAEVTITFSGSSQRTAVYPTVTVALLTPSDDTYTYIDVDPGTETTGLTESVHFTLKEPDTEFRGQGEITLAVDPSTAAEDYTLYVGGSTKPAGSDVWETKGSITQADPNQKGRTIPGATVTLSVQSPVSGNLIEGLTFDTAEYTFTFLERTQQGQADALPGVSSEERARIAAALTMDRVIFNEFRNATTNTHDWVELRNVSNTDVTLDGWEVRILTDEGTSIVTFPAGTVLPVGGLLLLVNTDPDAPEMPLSMPEGEVVSVVDAELILPQANFTLLLRSDASWEDSVGNYFFGYEIPPTAPPLTTDAAWYRARPDVPGYQSEAWITSGYQEGLGYDEGVSAASALGTPGYPQASLIGDVNGDGTVNILDLVSVASRFGETAAPEADVNGDGTVNTEDLVAVANSLGSVAAAPSAQTLHASHVQQWVTLAKQTVAESAIETSVAAQPYSYERGIQVLEQLLATLVPKSTALLANYPNPFNPETWIPYRLAKGSDVQLRIYDTQGRLVRHLEIGHQVAGVYQTRSRAAYWDGRNALGEAVASGLYFYTLTAGDFSATRRMLILK